jgi:hypothetical protein
LAKARGSNILVFLGGSNICPANVSSSLSEITTAGRFYLQIRIYILLQIAFIEIGSATIPASLDAPVPSANDAHTATRPGMKVDALFQLLPAIGNTIETKPSRQSLEAKPTRTIQTKHAPWP